MHTVKAAVAAVVMVPTLIAVCLWAQVTGEETVGFVA
jgi:hypothetical protein